MVFRQIKKTQNEQICTFLNSIFILNQFKSDFFKRLFKENKLRIKVGEESNPPVTYLINREAMKAYKDKAEFSINQRFRC